MLWTVLAASLYYYFRSRTGVIFLKIIIVNVYVPLNARHCAEYPQLAKSSLWARSVHSKMQSLEQGRGEEGQGTWTPNHQQCTLVECVVTEPESIKSLGERGRLLPFSWQSGYEWRRGKPIFWAEEKNSVNMEEVKICGKLGGVSSGVETWC